jgi:glycosyltransferase involved in cell wall biosynthesis
MKILIGHNYYLQPGGEDAVFHSEAQLLESMGHDVIRFTEHNRSIGAMSAPGIALTAFWSTRSERSIRHLIEQTDPAVAHFHNTFFRISPSAYHACKAMNVPVVQTLHNYRLVCPTATLYRNRRPCEDCLGKKFPWPGILNRCYHASALQSAVVALTLTFHHLKHTWQNAVDLYIALTEFARRKFIAGGLPAEKIVVKPNFVHPDPGPGTGAREYVLFVGRLTEEKGLHTLLDAWRTLPDIPLKIAGGGLMLHELQTLISHSELEQVELLGPRPHDEILGLMKNARVLVFPSEWYEGFPMTIVEAFACGLPVLGADIGSTAEIVEEGQTGLLFKPGDSAELAQKAAWAWSQTHAVERMGAQARLKYERTYTAEKNYESLYSIYNKVRRL